MENTIDAQGIKEALNNRAEKFARCLFPAGHKEGREWNVGSLDGEPGKSLSICIDGNKVGVFKDFATEQSGNNFVELYRQKHGCTFAEALEQCAHWLGMSACDNANSCAKPKGKVGASTQHATDSFLSFQDCHRAIKMAETLRAEPDLCGRIATSRGWNPETIRNLTLEPSLGWHDGKLAFIYETGVKLRWRQQGERIIKWAFGQTWLWRGSNIDMFRKIILTEGETDGITLIDAGLESDGDTLIVAIPSASTFPERWALYFTGRDVVLAFDSDSAGEAATGKVSSILYPVVASLTRFDWEGLRHAS